jgi:GTP cyclohydrolase I
MTKRRPTHGEAIDAVRTLIAYIGDDPDRPGLQATPGRVLRAWAEEWGAGYREPDFALTMFDGDGDDYGDQMVFMNGISVHSFCAHHMVPFYGVASVAYIPRGGKIVGLSKLPRIVEHFASRLQVQERLTAQVADFIVNHISPDCAISIKATHLCMVTRGVRQPHSMTVTTALRGCFLNDTATQSEFIARSRDKD